MEQILLYNKETIQNRICDLSADICKAYYKDNKPLLVVGILNGAFLFLSDLIRQLDYLDIEVDFIKISSYSNNRQTSNLVFEYDGLQKYNLKNYNILIVEDIIDTGNSMKRLKEYLLQTYDLQENQLAFCTLLYKKFKNKTDFVPDYIGFELDSDYYVVGYGLDDNNKYRELDYIYYNKD